MPNFEASDCYPSRDLPLNYALNDFFCFVSEYSYLKFIMSHLTKDTN